MWCPPREVRFLLEHRDPGKVQSLGVCWLCWRLVLYPGPGMLVKVFQLPVEIESMGMRTPRLRIPQTSVCVWLQQEYKLCETNPEVRLWMLGSWGSQDRQVLLRSLNSWSSGWGQRIWTSANMAKGDYRIFLPLTLCFTMVCNDRLQFAGSRREEVGGVNQEGRWTSCGQQNSGGILSTKWCFIFFRSKWVAVMF